MQTFVLHVGPMKTSTTYVQQVLCENRNYLKSMGWVYPGRGSNQQHAFYGLCGSDIPWVTPATQVKNASAGKQLIEDIKSADASVIVSAEALASLSCDGIERLMGRMPTPDTIVFTHRPLEKLIPSAWQQYLKGGGTETLEHFTNRLLNEMTQAEGSLYRGYALGDSVERWKSIVKSRIVVMKVPTAKKDADKTWPLFQQASGLPVLKDYGVKEANSSLSSEAADLLRSFNIALMKKGAFDRDILNIFVNDCLLKDRFGSSKVALQENYFDQVSRLEEEQIAKAHKFADQVFSAA